MALFYFRGDELPDWVAAVTLNGTVPDLSEHSFTVTLAKAGEDDVVKTTGITGDASGAISVKWALGELDIAEGVWSAQLTATDPDGFDFTVEVPLTIEPRRLAEPT